MRNRAKCKLCQSVLESFTIQDYVECKCGEIGIWGGNQNLECCARHWSNFLRLDEKDNEIPVIVTKEDNVKQLDISQEKPKRKELLAAMDEMQQGNLFILEECKNTIREIQSYVWDAKAAKRGDDQPLKENDHAVDALRYAVFSHKIATYEPYKHNPSDYQHNRFRSSF